MLLPSLCLCVSAHGSSHWLAGSGWLAGWSKRVHVESMAPSWRVVPGLAPYLVLVRSRRAPYGIRYGMVSMRACVGPETGTAHTRVSLYVSSVRLSPITLWLLLHLCHASSSCVLRFASSVCCRSTLSFPCPPLCLVELCAHACIRRPSPIMHDRGWREGRKLIAGWTGGQLVHLQSSMTAWVNVGQ